MSKMVITALDQDELNKRLENMKDWEQVGKTDKYINSVGRLVYRAIVKRKSVQL